MKRRAPDEHVEPFRRRYHSDEAKPIREFLEEWCAEHEAELIGAEPKMPEGIEDRAADCWEPLLAIADAAGTDWPKRARDAALVLTRRAKDEGQTRGVELLSHIREAFANEDKLWTETLLHRLCNKDESPWREVSGGRALNDRGLATSLKPYGVKSRDVWLSGKTKKGYCAEDFHDAWGRYLGPCHTLRDEGDEGEEIDNENKNLADIADIAHRRGPSEPAMAQPEIPDSDLEERAAILEYDGGHSREEAEALAAKELLSTSERRKA
jgi:hypothetical protein